MKLSKVKIKNFRSYSDEVTIDIDNLTAFVGKNDVGKSTILEALDIFFNENKGTIKIDTDDINKDMLKKDEQDIEISAVFENLPQEIIIDATNPTTLKNEYLLSQDGTLEIKKRYPKAGKEKVYIKAFHPMNDKCSDLLNQKIGDLKKILKNNSIDTSKVDQTKSASIRHKIWEHFSNDLQLEDTKIDTSKEDAKNIWSQLQNYMPVYALFQSDRKNSDGDSEIQDPMKLAVKEIMKKTEVSEALSNVADIVMYHQ